MKNIDRIRSDFPILTHYQYNGKSLVYLDNAATTQKPNQVIQSQVDFYSHRNANIHRGVYALSTRATDMYESARLKVAKFINAKTPEEIVFTKGCTEGINTVAVGLSRSVSHDRSDTTLPILQEGDEIILSEMEHHANLVPWQVLAAEKHLVLKFIPVTSEGELDLEVYPSLFSEKTKLVSVVHASNSLGTVNPVKKIVDLAHTHGALVLVDGAQMVAHEVVDVQDLGCDFYVFSGHKMYGPTGVGVLYVKKDVLETLPAFQYGGDMVEDVTFEYSTFKAGPARFEAGTPNISGAIGLGIAIDYLNRQREGQKYLFSEHEQNVYAYMITELRKIPGVMILPGGNKHIPVISLGFTRANPTDVAIYLDQHGICVRTGYHCTQPLLEKLGFDSGTLRISLAMYNTKADIDVTLEALHVALRIVR